MPAISLLKIMYDTFLTYARLSALAVALTAPLPGWAQSSASPQPELLAPVIVTGAAPRQALTFTTDPKQPRQPLPASDGADYLKTIPGFSAIGSGGTNGDPVLRGMMGSRLNILAQDSAMPGACPSRMDAPTSYISPQNFDELIVVKGPQTVLWGPGASAGTVRFKRTPPRFTEPGILFDGLLTAGSWGRNDLSIDLSAGAPDYYARVTANHAKAQDYKDGDGNFVPSRWEKWNADLALGLTPDADTLLELMAGTGDGKARYAGRGMDGARFKRESVGLRLQKDNISQTLKRLEAQIAYNRADHVMDNYSLRSFAPVGGMNMPMDSAVQRSTWSARLAGTLALAENVQWIAGADLQDSTHRARSGGRMQNYRDQPWARDARLRNIGLFNELSWQASAQDRWVAGLRWDRAQAKDYRPTVAASGHGGMSHGGMGAVMVNPTADQTRSDWLPSGFVRYEGALAQWPLTWYVGLGHVQRFPDYWELFSPKSGPQGSANAFAGIQPEKTTQLDAGLQYQGRTVQTWLNVYAGRVEDYILFDYSGGASKARNVDARIFGGELGLSWQAAAHWSTQASLAYAWGKNTTDQRAMPQIPPLELRLSATYDDGIWSAGALWRLVAAQKRYAIDQGSVVGKDFGPSAGFGTLSLNAAYVLNKRLRLAVGIDNVFNKTYGEHLNLAGNAGFGYAAHTSFNNPGRTFWATASVQF